MADAEQGAMQKDPVESILRLILVWIFAFIVLVVAVGTSWTNGVRFGVITLAWLLLTIPLMIRTARWLAEREQDE